MTPQNVVLAALHRAAVEQGTASRDGRILLAFARAIRRGQVRLDQEETGRSRNTWLILFVATLCVLIYVLASAPPCAI